MGTYNIKTDVEEGDEGHPEHHNAMGTAINDLDTRVSSAAGALSSLTGSVSSMSSSLSTLSSEVSDKVDTTDPRLAKADTAVQPENIGTAAAKDSSEFVTAVTSGAKLWIGTQAEYNTIPATDDDTVYIIREE